MSQSTTTDPISPKEEPIKTSDLPAPERLRGSLVFALAFGQLGIAIPAVGMFLVGWPITIAAMEPDNKAFYLALISGLSAFVGVILSPVAGALSDRCTSRLGMRRPFLLVGGLVDVLSLLVMAFAPNVGVLVAGAVGYAVGAAIYNGGNYALVPDQVPDRHRGKVMGLIQMMTAFGGVLTSVFLPMFIHDQRLLFGIPAAVMVFAVTIVILIIRDRHITREEVGERLSLRALVGEFKIDPRKIPDFSWAWSGKAVVTLGTVLTGAYTVYFLTDHLLVSDAELPGLLTLTGIVALATMIVGALAGSWISDRFLIRKKMVLYTALIIATGAIVAALAPNVSVYIIGLILIGLGTGTFFPVDGALMIDVLPGAGKESGKFMGVMTLADQVPRAIGPFLAAGVLALGALLPSGGYPAVLFVGGLIAVVGGLLVRKIKGSV